MPLLLVVLAQMCCSMIALAQKASDEPPGFEVAALKRSPSPPPRYDLSQMGTRVRYTGAPLLFLVQNAYQIDPYQLKGPSWLLDEHYELEAIMPEGSTKEQVPAMLRRLLEERLGLSAHREVKQSAAYVLAVRGDGIKAKPSDPGAPRTGDPLMSLPIVDPSGGRFYVNGPMTMKVLAQLLTGLMGRPVIDKTGLPGQFDLSIYASTGQSIEEPRPLRLPDGTTLADNPPSIFKALLPLGLSLETRTVPIEYIVIDRVLRDPTEN